MKVRARTHQERPRLYTGRRPTEWIDEFPLPLADPGAGYFLYFMQDEKGGPIKVGRGRNLDARLRQNQTGNAGRIVVRKVIELAREDAIAAEARIHRRLERFRMCGEWFLPLPVFAEAVGAAAGSYEHNHVRAIMERAYEAGLERGRTER